MEFEKLTLPNLVDTLTPFLDRPVLDGTGLKGNYQAVLKLPMEMMFTMMQDMARNSGMPAPGPGRGPGGPKVAVPEVQAAREEAPEGVPIR